MNDKLKSVIGPTLWLFGIVIVMVGIHGLVTSAQEVKTSLHETCVETDLYTMGNKMRKIRIYDCSGTN